MSKPMDSKLGRENVKVLVTIGYWIQIDVALVIQLCMTKFKLCVAEVLQQ